MRGLIRGIATSLTRRGTAGKALKGVERAVYKADIGATEQEGEKVNCFIKSTDIK
jgi:hypothetical protein